MKKLVTAFAACMLAGLVSAQVESQNIVGYSSTPLNQGFNMIGVNFVSVGAINGSVDIQNLLTPAGLTGVDWSTVSGGDQLYIWDANAQGYPVFYSWTGADADTQLATTGVNNKWVDLGTFDGTAATIPSLVVPAGTAAWIVKNDAVSASVVFSGQVQQSVTTNHLVQGFNMFANSLPMDLSVNGGTQVTFSGLAGVDWSTVSGGDQLLVWDSSSQGYPVFYSWTGADADTQLATTGVSNKWVDLGTFDGTAATIPAITIPVGGAAWIVRTTGTAASVNIAGL